MSSQISAERKRFEALVERAEADLKNNPKRYKRKLLWLASLGYCYLFGIMAIILLLIAGTVLMAFKSTALMILLIKKKLIFVLIGILYVMIRALWVKLEAPQGYQLKRKEYPKLFAEIDRLRKELDAPAIHQVILTPELNAAIQQTPRLGAFGWQKNTLILGLELMVNLSEEEMLAVIAHELGHLSGNHSRFNGWIYRVRITWHRIMVAFDNANRWAQIFFGKFFDWYAPHFNAYSFALARANEFEADAAAVEVTSKQALVNGLVRLETNAVPISQRFWQNTLQKADHNKQIESSVYSSMMSFVQEKPLEPVHQNVALEKALRVKTGHSDTHPAIKDRIAPHTNHIELPPPLSASAAQVFLGDQLQETLKHFDRQWAKHNHHGWIERYEYSQQARKALADLANKPEQERSAADWLTIAEKTEELVPDEDPLPLYRKVLELNADDVHANFAVGRLLLDRQDESGLAYLEKTMSDVNAVIPACEHAYLFYTSNDNPQKAEQYRLRAEAHQDLLYNAELERQQLTAKDKFQKPDIDEALIQEIERRISRLPKLKHAWLSQKKVQHLPEERALVIVFQGKGDDLADQIAEMLDLPHSYFVIGKKGDHAAISRKALKSAIQLI